VLKLKKFKEKNKRTGGVTQVMEHLLYKDDTLSSNPRTIKRKEDIKSNQSKLTPLAIIK
jgi:hypothetical protein